MHAEAFAYIAAHLPVDAERVLEFGSRNINGTARTLVPDAEYVGVDISDGDGVDIVDDAATVHIPGKKFDVVVCAEVFEHANDKTCEAIAANAANHLRKGGVFIATMAGPGREPHSAVDGAELRDGEYYRNVPESKLRRWLNHAGFSSCQVDTLGPDIRAVAVK
jgi:SAM-dependent methyltransferase